MKIVKMIFTFILFSCLVSITQDSMGVIGQSSYHNDLGKKTNRWFEREKYIAQHLQPTWLRVIKFPVFIIAGIILYRKKGWRSVLNMILFLVLFGIVLHFFLRYMTDGWTKEWWFVQKIITPFD